MITDIVVGDITSTDHACDIMIAMNTKLQDVRGIGRRVITRYKKLQDLPLGAVLTFPWDGSGRMLHMLICHELGVGGWKNADRHLRYGMDHIAYREEQSSSERGHGIVQVGAGRVGKRDGADTTSINTAIALSLLPVTMFIYDQPKLFEEQAAVLHMPPLKPSLLWTRERGEVRLAA